MSDPLSPNTQAILLLTASLGAGRGDAPNPLLTPGEYKRLARLLRENGKEPADLLSTDAGSLIDICAAQFEASRLKGLLDRGFLLAQAVDHWNARSIWVISRADPNYPKRLKTLLKEDAPAVLYGCGDHRLLEQGGLAVVGSRNVDEKLVEFTESVGRISAGAHRNIVSGGAKGIDRAAMNGALIAGGNVLGVMADSLERAALARDNREPLAEGQLVLISPYDPGAGFNVGHAMQRNKLIYALADAALVVQSDFEKGGTWAGAIEQIDRLRYVPVFVRDEPGSGKGNSALLARGALAWTNPQNGNELEEAILASVEALRAGSDHDAPLLVVREEMPDLGRSVPSMTDIPDPENPKDSVTSGHLPPESVLFDTVRVILKNQLIENRSETEITELLGVTKQQAKAWIVRLISEGVIEKVPKTKPTRYRTIEQAGLLF
jgi:predicted Rossmann fold nucleotide-binding protein DprA/Smf involved in DNA uptake